MNIVIPSASRHDRVFTKDFIPPSWRDKLYIVVPNNQERKYRKHNPGFTIIPCPVKNNLGGKRQWIHEQSDDDPYLFMLDDDAKLYVRTNLYQNSKLRMIPDDIKEQSRLLQTLERTLRRRFAWTAISYRLGINNVLTPFRDNIRSTGVFAYNRDILNKEGIRFDVTRSMEDIQVVLSLMACGYGNRVWYTWSFNQTSNFKGGCSDWRTPEIKEADARKIHAMYPQYTKLVEKRPKSVCWFGVGNPIIELRVQWKQALKDGCKIRQSCDNLRMLAKH